MVAPLPSRSGSAVGRELAPVRSKDHCVQHPNESSPGGVSQNVGTEAQVSAARVSGSTAWFSTRMTDPAGLGTLTATSDVGRTSLATGARGGEEPDWGFGGASRDAMRVYERTLVGPLFEPWANLLLDELGVERGETLLDVAAGPGTLARLAAGRLGRHGQVTACDLSPGMLAVAREKDPLIDGAPIEYFECPAAALGVPDHAFDVATCQQGLQFFPDPSAALIEIRRVLKSGGRLGVSVWSAIDLCPPFARMADAIEEVIGEQVADRYRSGPFGLPDLDQLGQLLIAAGFDQVQVNERRLPVTFPGGPGQFIASLMASGIANDVEALDPQRREALNTEAAHLLAALTFDGRMVSEMTSNVATAVRGS